MAFQQFGATKGRDAIGAHRCGRDKDQEVWQVTSNLTVNLRMFFYCVCIPAAEFHAPRAQLPLFFVLTSDRRFQALVVLSNSLHSFYRFAPGDSAPLPFADWLRWFFGKPKSLSENRFARNTEYPIANSRSLVWGRDGQPSAATTPLAPNFHCL